jgi:aminoglycoside phosphotransferase (APT) family kinase protein
LFLIGLVQEVWLWFLDAHYHTRLCSALTRFPKTLIHGDVRLANLGIERSQYTKLIILDWARPTSTVPAVDLIYYLMTSFSLHLPISLEQSIDLYKERLASRLGDRFDESWWQPQLELSFLGVFAMMGIFKTYSAEHSGDELHRKQDRADLEWWSEKAREGTRWLRM